MSLQKYVLLPFLGFGALPVGLVSQKPQQLQTGNAWQVPDVSGISLGMTEEQVRAKLGPGYIFNAGKFEDPALRGLQAGSSQFTNGFTAWLFLFVNGRTALISYSKTFEPGTGPALDNAVQHAKDKYGVTPTNGNMEWVYLPGGQLVPPSNVELRGCAQGAGSPVFVPLMGKNGPSKGQVTFAPHAPEPFCPSSVSMRIFGSQGFVTAVSIDERDPRPILSEDARWTQVKTAQHTQQIDRAKKIADPF